MILKNTNSERTLKAYLKDFLNKKDNPREVFEKIFNIVLGLSKETKYAIKDVHNVLSRVNFDKIKNEKSFDSAVLSYFQNEIKKRLV